MKHYLGILITILLMLQTSIAVPLAENEVTPKVVAIDVCVEGSYKRGVQCEQCTKCGEFEITSHTCNSTHDSVCECIQGFYRDSENGQCKQCTKCAVGWGASPACTSTKNTVCVVCPKGSYSSVESSTEICQSCTLCDQRDEFVLKKCTTKQDTTCFKVKKKTSAVEEPSTTSSCVDEECIATITNSYLYTAPLYCAGLGAVILGLLVYVVFRCKANKKRSQMLTSTLKQPSGYHIVQQLPAYSHQAPASPVVYLQNSGKTITVTVSTNYAEVPSQVRRAVARGLSMDGSWLNLAHNLGFTPSQISQIQQKAEESNRRSSVGSVLMSEWLKRDFSTVGVIIHALASINRLDLVALIQNSNSMKGSEIV